MGKMIFPDGVSTNEGGYSALDTMLLERVDTGVWELAQTGVQYFAPDQHGGLYGKVIRQYFTGTVTATYTTLSTSIVYSKILSSGGWVDDSASGFLRPFGTTGTTFAYGRDSVTDIAFSSDQTGDTYYVWVDYTLTTPPSRSPSFRVMPTIDPTVLQRVDTLQWEKAQTGVQYFSPDQHGGIFGKVIRKFYSGNPSGSATTTLEAGVSSTWSKLVDVGGNCVDTDTGSQTNPNSYNATTSVVRLSIETTDLILRLGSAYYGTGDTYFVWADFTLITPPSTSPTGQPFADPFSGMLKRVDTGVWELAQNGVEYYSPDQSASGIFSARIKRKYIAAGTSSGTVIAAGTTALVNCNAVVDGGFYHRAAGSARLSVTDFADIRRAESDGDIELILGGTGQSVLNGSWVDYV